MLNINGIELDFDMSDADVYENYMKAAVEVDKAVEMELTEEEIDKDPMKVGELLRNKCAATKKFVDAVFGEGIGEKVCGKGNSWNKHKEVLMSIIEDVERQTREAEEKRVEFAKRNGNRETRRNLKKSGK